MAFDRKEYDRKYGKTPKKREINSRYRSSKKGKETDKRGSTRYREKLKADPVRFEEHRKRRNAGVLANMHAKESRDFVKPKCSKCSSDVNVQKHHKDYKKPHDYEWLCQDCHALLRRSA